jgi:polysaccharide biosynthesis protein PslG
MKDLIIFFIVILINSTTVAQHDQLLWTNPEDRSIHWENLLSIEPGLKQIGWIATRHANEIESSSWWSIGCETLDRDYAKFDVYKDYVGELGIKKARIQSGWAKCEKEKGVYDFAWLDSIVYSLTEMKIKPWVCLGYGNPLYGSEAGLGSKIFTDEIAMNAWIKYVETTVLRYKDVVTEWEVWNEPRSSGKDYAELLMKTVETIKNVQPDAKILGFALPGIALKFTEEVFEVLEANNKLDIVDYLTYHPYNKNPDDSYQRVEQLRTLAHSYNPKIKLFQGENGAEAELAWQGAMRHHQWTEISQAKWILRRMAGDRIREIPSSIFTIIDLKYPHRLQSYGLIRSNLYQQFVYKRPQFYGVQHMAGFFDDSIELVGALEFNANTSRKMTVAGFKKEGTPVIVLWYNDRIPDDKLHWDLVNLTITGINFKDPVYIEMISGKAFEINNSDWENKKGDVIMKNLPVWDSVIMIVERSQINMRSEK